MFSSHSILLVLALGSFTLLGVAQGVHAETSTITTEVNVSASSGGNAADGGMLTTGDRSASVRIEQTVNGEIVEPVIVESNDDGDPQEAKTIEVQQEVSASEGASPRSETAVRLDGELVDAQGASATTENQQTPETDPTENSLVHTVVAWCKSVVAAIGHFVGNIFSSYA